MTGQVMTAAELAEARDFVAGMGGPCDCLICNHFGTLAPRLLATVDARTERAERAERERDAYKRAKAENDERFCNERDDARRERDEALALADARGRALRSIRYLKVSDDDNTGTLMYAIEEAYDALKLTAPEALRQQQEREAALERVAERAKMLRDAEADYYDYEELDRALSALDALQK